MVSFKFQVTQTSEISLSLMVHARHHLELDNLVRIFHLDSSASDQSQAIRTILLIEVAVW